MDLKILRQLIPSKLKPKLISIEIHDEGCPNFILELMENTL